MNSSLKHSFKAVITDLDGTLLPHGGKINEIALYDLKRLGEAGIIRVVATGRTLYSARQALSPDFPIDYLIFSSGAGILHWKDQCLLHSHHLEETETRRIAAYLWNFNINFTIQREIPDNHFFYYTQIYPVHVDYQHRIDSYNSFGSPIFNPAEIQGKATQFILILHPHQIRLLHEIRTSLHPYSVIRSTSPVDNHAIWLEIFPAGIHKGFAVRQLLEGLNIDCTEAAGIGNDYNDIDFLNLCGQAYLVANAPKNLKPDYKTVASVSENGFSQFIRLLFG